MVVDFSAHDGDFMVTADVAEDSVGDDDTVIPFTSDQFFVLQPSLLYLAELPAGVLGTVLLAGLWVFFPSVFLHQDADALVRALVVSGFDLDLRKIHDHLIVGDLTGDGDGADAAVACDAVLRVGVVKMEHVGIRVFFRSFHG